MKDIFRLHTDSQKCSSILKLELKSRTFYNSAWPGLLQNIVFFICRWPQTRIITTNFSETDLCIRNSRIKYLSIMAFWSQPSQTIFWVKIVLFRKKKNNLIISCFPDHPANTNVVLTLCTTILNFHIVEHINQIWIKPSWHDQFWPYLLFLPLSPSCHHFLCSLYKSIAL